MKTSFYFVLLIFGLQDVDAQVVKDPLRAYFQILRDLPQVPSQTEIISFTADFTGDGRKSVFITSNLERLGPHGTYAWSVYYPMGSGGYEVASDSTHFLVAGFKGPNYIGYIDQIEKYGAITASEGGKYGITAWYLNNGEIRSRSIDEERGHADATHYPRYFRGLPDYGITRYRLSQLIQKYGNPNPDNVIAPPP